MASPHISTKYGSDGNEAEGSSLLSTKRSSNEEHQGSKQKERNHREYHEVRSCVGRNQTCLSVLSEYFVSFC